MPEDFVQSPTRLQPEMQPPTDVGAPSAQLPTTESAAFEQARSTITALRGRGRQANGQAGAGNTLALRHGLRSARLLEHPDVAEWHRQQVEAITADLGGPSELSALRLAAVREVARLEVIAGALGDELLDGGVLTGKGKCRAATTTYLQVLDRLLRLSQLVGLDRKAKQLPNPADWLEGRP
jgi:hypothetical protein